MRLGVQDALLYPLGMGSLGFCTADLFPAFPSSIYFLQKYLYVRIFPKFPWLGSSARLKLSKHTVLQNRHSGLHGCIYFKQYHFFFSQINIGGERMSHKCTFMLKFGKVIFYLLLSTLVWKQKLKKIGVISK